MLLVGQSTKNVLVLHSVCNYKGFHKARFLLGGGGCENMQMECFDCRETV